MKWTIVGDSPFYFLNDFLLELIWIVVFFSNQSGEDLRGKIAFVYVSAEELFIPVTL